MPCHHYRQQNISVAIDSLKICLCNLTFVYIKIIICNDVISARTVAVHIIC